jgi:hypothetical protein
MSYLWLPMGDMWVREVSYNYSSNKFVRHVCGWTTPPLASLGGNQKNRKRVISRHPALSLGALRPELDREHLGRYLDEWMGTRPRLVPFH